MNYCRYLLIGLMALIITGCGQTVKESIKQPLVKKSSVGAEKTIVILPFADYSYADDMQSAFRRSLLINENLTDELGRNSFNLPVQEDVFMYLANQNIINVVAYEDSSTSVLDDEIAGEWSGMMKEQLQRYSDMTKSRDRNNQAVADSPGTHGLSSQEIVKIGRYFGADYILRGRILEYDTRQEHSWSPMKRGIIPFAIGSTSQIFYGFADSDEYDDRGNMLTGGTMGAIIGYNANGPWGRNSSKSSFFGTTGTGANTLLWGAVGAAIGENANHRGRTDQAVVQMRIWIQDAYSGEVVWNNRVDVKVSPETVFADNQRDALFESATEKAIEALITNFVDSQSI